MFKKWLRGVASSQRSAAMARLAAQSWAEVQRQWRLVLRHARHGRASFGSAPSPAKAAALRTLFRVVNAHLNQHGGEHLIVYGTLLGWHREGRILPHDQDVDFGAPVAAFPRIRASGAALPPGFTLHDTSHRHRGPKLYIEYRGWEADIYFFVGEAGILRSTERSRNPGETLPFPREWFFPRQSAIFLGEPTLVPAQPQAWLEHVYGYLGADAVRDPVTRYFRPRTG